MILAKSLSGHDAGAYYVVIREEGPDVYLANGTNKTIDNEKKKRQKHIQKIVKLPIEVTEILSKETLTDLEIKRAIKLYKKSISE